MKVCDNCRDLEFCHRTSVCDILDDFHCKLTKKHLDNMNNDMIQEIIEKAKNKEKFDDNKK